jgi:hypothetical protein
MPAGAADATLGFPGAAARFPCWRGGSALNFGAYPMANGRTRLANRFCADVYAAPPGGALMTPHAAAEAQLVTFTPDDIDWDDEIRLALEERTSLSPDALTGMEASLRFTGPENMHTRIFGRLSAWQNWVFQRPNAVGEGGALKRFGSGTLRLTEPPELFLRAANGLKRVYDRTVVVGSRALRDRTARSIGRKHGRRYSPSETRSEPRERGCPECEGLCRHARC